ncbi:MAG: SH3 domain-containing protein [Pseudomonadota bacterium]|nr:SH3 domain-containing protein [Pseudomonadota bacterium]
MQKRGTIWLMVAGIGLIVSALSPAMAALVQKKPPYFASIAASKARMRTGPGKTYPASWLYRRADLPVRVIDTYAHGQWYKIEDPAGTQGWMLASLIGEQRSGMVMGQVIEMREAPRSDARVLWRAAPGVVGRLSKCARGWCWFDVHGQSGFVEADRLWGIEPGEEIP